MHKKYKKGKLTVHWNLDVCIHSGVCAAGLPKVFDPRRRPWIDLEQANDDEIKKQVSGCPSQALTFSEE